MDVRLVRHQDGPCCGIAKKDNLSKNICAKLESLLFFCPLGLRFDTNIQRGLFPLKRSIPFLGGEDE
jgi:hypothetical protein